jgi:hypothetical protein
MLRTEMLGLKFLVNLPILCHDCTADVDHDRSIIACVLFYEAHLNYLFTFNMDNIDKKQ